LLWLSNNKVLCWPSKRVFAFREKKNSLCTLEFWGKNANRLLVDEYLQRLREHGCVRLRKWQWAWRDLLETAPHASWQGNPSCCCTCNNLCTPQNRIHLPTFSSKLIAQITRRWMGQLYRQVLIGLAATWSIITEILHFVIGFPPHNPHTVWTEQDCGAKKVVHYEEDGKIGIATFVEEQTTVDCSWSPTKTFTAQWTLLWFKLSIISSCDDTNTLVFPED
jgi:hypothetical protein